MRMMTKNSLHSKEVREYAFWSYCLAFVSILAIADVLTGGLLRESLAHYKVEYAASVFAMIATVGVYASDGPIGARLIRSYSRHKL